jgi:hypothetical protein
MGHRHTFGLFPRKGVSVRRWLAIALVLAFVALLAVPAAGAAVLPRGAKPMEMSLKLWTVTYVRTLAQRSPAVSTALFADSNGKCGSAFGKVWFLPDASPPDDLVSQCVIPRGKLLFVPGAWGFLAATRTAIDFIPTFRRFVVASRISVDGRFVGSGHYVQTPVFQAVFPLRNPFGAQPGLWNLIAAGHFAILRLPPGQHTVVQNAAYRGPVESSSFTYHLTIR